LSSTPFQSFRSHFSLKKKKKKRERRKGNQDRKIERGEEKGSAGENQLIFSRMRAKNRIKNKIK
jgi:hypothetical protein